MLIPHQNECLQMLCTMEMPDHIQSHSRLVSRVALALAEHRKEEELRATKESLHRMEEEFFRRLWDIRRERR